MQSERRIVDSSKEGTSVAGRLRELAALRDDGIISDEEFQAKKTEMMADY